MESCGICVYQLAVGTKNKHVFVSLGKIFHLLFIVRFLFLMSLYQPMKLGTMKRYVCYLIITKCQSCYMPTRSCQAIVLIW